MTHRTHGRGFRAHQVVEEVRCGPAGSSTTRDVPAALLLAVVVALGSACGGGGESGEITPPEPRYGQLDVPYPIELWDREMEGETILRVRIEEDGSVAAVEVTVSSGEAAFDSAAVRGVRRARFEPARRGEEDIAVWATLPVVFSKKPR